MSIRLISLFAAALLIIAPIFGRPDSSQALEPLTPFEDTNGSMFAGDIAWLYGSGITRGCAANAFCPDGLITRGQFATFIARMLHLPAAQRDHFTDDNASSFESDINRIAAAGVTRGCGDGRFCPDQDVTRDQMAALLVRANDVEVPIRADYFWDDSASEHEGAINRLASAGLTQGCGSGRYCPAAAVTRGQMAAFLHRTRTVAPTPPVPVPFPTDGPTSTGQPSPSASPTAPLATALPTAAPTIAPPAAPTVAPTATPVPVLREFDVTTFGARGDGVTDDTAAIQRAVNGAEDAGGGRVVLPAGIYPVTTLDLKSGISLEGAGRDRTAVTAIGAVGRPTVFADDEVGLHVAHLRIVGRGVNGGSQDEFLLNMVNVSNSTFDDLAIDRAQGIGVQLEGTGSFGNRFSNITVTNTFVRNTGYHGVAFWFYAGPHDNVVTDLTTDTSDRGGLVITAGTRTGPNGEVYPNAQCRNNIFDRINIYRTGRRDIGSNAISITGSSGTRLTNFVIDDSGYGAGISLQQSSDGWAQEDSVIQKGQMKNIGLMAFDFESVRRNTIRDVSVTNIGMRAADRNYLAVFTNSGVNTGHTLNPTTDNVLENITVTQTAGRYDAGVHLNSLTVAVVRNRVVSMTWGSPTGGPYVVSGSKAPLNGADANVIE